MPVILLITRSLMEMVLIVTVVVQMLWWTVELMFEKAPLGQRHISFPPRRTLFLGSLRRIILNGAGVTGKLQVLATAARSGAGCRLQASDEPRSPAPGRSRVGGPNHQTTFQAFHTNRQCA